ncbi:MAG TPA: polysaccharide pyruvyl transferase family protein [Polyangiaceae bacterium]|nr:polysaccharide pyruvyl transferase family protein [Polyangiaceae bacterium]
MKVIEVQGVNYGNKGAQLMLEACRQHFDGRAKLVLPFRIGSFERRRTAGLGHLIRVQRERFPGMNALLAAGVALAPRRVLSAGDVWRESALDALVDASGFLYSDHWGIDAIERMAKRAKSLKRSRRKVVLLPQAFGPFDGPASKRAMREIILHCDLVFARDKVSLEHLLDALGGERPAHIRQAPDFTNLLNPRAVAAGTAGSTLILVPNARMLDKTSASDAAEYPALLARVARRGQELGFRPVLMVHDQTGDNRLADVIETKLSFRLERITLTDPLALKAELASAAIVVGSRFHALVGALSSGTPTIAVGWSHKYEELMRDYGLDNASVRVADFERVAALLDQWADATRRGALRAELQARASQQKALTHAMWRQVDAVLTA